MNTIDYGQTCARMLVVISLLVLVSIPSWCSAYNSPYNPFYYENKLYNNYVGDDYYYYYDDNYYDIPKEYNYVDDGTGSEWFVAKKQVAKPQKLTTVEAYQSDIGNYNNDVTLVRTTHGLVRGQTEMVRIKGNQEVPVDVFWAIPYAKPPVGELRFKHPVPAEPWDGILEAKGPPNACMQMFDPEPIVLPNPETPLSEDCLYLTIWRPRCSGSDFLYEGDFEKLATFVFIYGGGYMTGTATSSIYNSPVLAATECIIVAAMNYRLGAFGFLFLDNADAPGNMGLLDMAVATRWIKENVGNFGGDPKRITLSGFSAGGASVILFLLSPLTRDLVGRAIIQSGTPLNFLSLQNSESAQQSAQTLAKTVGCDSTTPAQIVACLKKVDPGLLTQRHASLATTSPGYTMVPVVDRYFLLHRPQDMLASKDFKPCSIMLGSNRDEGTFFLHRYWPHVYSFYVDKPAVITEQVLETYLAQFFNNFMQPDYIPQTVAAVKDVYQLGASWEHGDAHRELLNAVMGDVIFTCPTRLLAGIFAQAYQRVYLYSNAHPHDYTGRPFWAGAMHGDDLHFFFGTASVDRMHFSDREGELSEIMMKYWGNFVKYGNPTPDGFVGLKWPTYWTPDPGGTVTFTPAATVKIGTTEDRRCSFWNSLPPEYFRQ